MGRTNLTYLAKAITEVARLTILEGSVNWQTPRAMGSFHLPLPERGESGSPRIVVSAARKQDIAEVHRDTVNQRRKR